MKSIYFIREFKLKGASFKGYTHVLLSDKATIQRSGNKILRVYDEGGIYGNTHYYSISEKPEGINLETETHFPYFAKVTQDLPGSAKGINPKVYDNCQLTTQLPNNYLVFQDTKTGELLKIAMNSHYYEPINQKPILCEQ